MALARIITRSHQYAQQLALDLLARGYAVEIVSPDTTPSGPADLELRVEAGGTDAQGQVTEIREHGKPSRSMDYLLRLKPMMADLLRRWPASTEARPSSSEKGSDLNFNAEVGRAEDAELPSGERLRQSEPAHFASESPEYSQGARLVSPASQQKSPSAASSIFSITGEPLSWAESEPERRSRLEVWFWRAAVGFACMALLILALGMAMRRNPATPVQAAVPAATQTVTATTQPSPVTPKPSAASVAPLPTKAVVSTAAPVAAIAKAKPSAAVHRARVRHNDELGDGDTTITHFNTKAAEPPKAAANQGSGIKHYSDLD